LGTNTFHLVVFEEQQGEITEIYRKRHHVFLSEGGINIIGPAAMTRAKDAINDFVQALEKWQPTLRIVGTEALRKASNGNALRVWIEEQIGTSVSLISGEREAELIAKGVMWEWRRTMDNALIMDIGGGSVEFIHVVDNVIVWKGSFPVGVGVLHHFSAHEEPISTSDKAKIVGYIESHCVALVDYLSKVQIDQFIGASGSFELIPSIKQGRYPATLDNTTVPLHHFHEIKDQIYRSDLQERLTIKGLPPVRAELIVVAFVLMEWALMLAPTETIHISKYAVKEGIISELLHYF